MSFDLSLFRYMTIDKVPDCTGLMKFTRLTEEKAVAVKEIEEDDDL